MQIVVLEAERERLVGEIEALKVAQGQSAAVIETGKATSVRFN